VKVNPTSVSFSFPYILFHQILTNAGTVFMIAMVTPRVQIPKARSVVPAKKDFLEMEKKVAAVSITMRRPSNRDGDAKDDA